MKWFVCCFGDCFWGWSCVCFCVWSRVFVQLFFELGWVDNCIFCAIVHFWNAVFWPVFCSCKSVGFILVKKYVFGHAVFFHFCCSCNFCPFLKLSAKLTNYNSNYNCTCFARFEGSTTTLRRCVRVCYICWYMVFIK